jgi:hypothetical protein
MILIDFAALYPSINCKTIPNGAKGKEKVTAE